MTEDNYKALREAAAKATPGPWEADTLETCTCGDPDAHGSVHAGVWKIADCTRTHSKRPEVIPSVNARYIAAASPDVIASLLSDLDAANARADRAELSANLLAGDLTDMARACGIRDNEYPRKAIERELATLRDAKVLSEIRAERLERERDDALAQLDAMTNQAVMLSGRRATIVDVSERDAILSEIAHALDIPDASLPSILGAIAGSDTVISQLQAEVKRLRDAMPSAEMLHDLDYLLSCVDGHPNVADEYERVSAWHAHIDAARTSDDAAARFRSRADKCDPVEVPVLATGVDAPCLVCHLPDGQHRMSCDQRDRDSRAAVGAPRVDAVCEECEGRGHMLRDEWSEDEQDFVPVVCDACNGTGRTEAAEASERARAAQSALASAISGRRRFFGPVLCVPGRDGWAGEVWLLDPEKRERGSGLVFKSLAQLRELHPELWIVRPEGDGILLDVCPIPTEVARG